jgi:heptosyltransferase-1
MEPGREDELGQAGIVEADDRGHPALTTGPGALHLAAALLKPGAAIYGPTNPGRNGPYGGSFRVLRAPDAVTSYSRRTDPDESMRAITPAMVAAALLAALESKSAGCPA